MSGPIFDKEKCIGCGICTTACNMIVLKEKGKGNVPVMAFPDICLHCGHCVAICPKEAPSHPEINMENFSPIGTLPSARDTQMLLESKRSIRQFKEKPIEKELIENLIHTASMAPSDLNSQNRTFLVVSNQEKLKTLEAAIVQGFKNYIKNAVNSGIPKESPKIAISQNIVNSFENGGSPVFKNAPCAIFIYGPKMEQELFAGHNAIIANTYLMIHAHSMGLGSCIVGRALYDTNALSDYFKIPDTQQIYTCITLGYPKAKYKKLVDRQKPVIIWN